MLGCYCGNSLSFQDCCEPYIKGIKKAPTCEALMRSRYSAYATTEVDYLVATTHLTTRKLYKKAVLKLDANVGLAIGEESVSYLDFVFGGYGYNTINKWKFYYSHLQTW